MKIRADIRAPLAAGLADETPLDVGQPSVIRPSVTADRGPMAALEIGAIDQEAANARGAHFAEGDLLTGRFHLKRGIVKSQLGSSYSSGRRLWTFW